MLGVIDRGLVTKDIKKKQIIEEHSFFSPLEQDVKNFKGPVLGYVTPVRCVFGNVVLYSLFSCFIVSDLLLLNHKIATDIHNRI